MAFRTRVRFFGKVSHYLAWLRAHYPSWWPSWWPCSVTSTKDQPTAPPGVPKTTTLATLRPLVDPVDPILSAELNWSNKLDQSHAAHSSSTLNCQPLLRLDDQAISNLADFQVPTSKVCAAPTIIFEDHLQTQSLFHYPTWWSPSVTQSTKDLLTAPQAAPKTITLATLRPIADPVDPILSAELNMSSAASRQASWSVGPLPRRACSLTANKTKPASITVHTCTEQQAQPLALCCGPSDQEPSSSRPLQLPNPQENKKDPEEQERPTASQVSQDKSSDIASKHSQLKPTRKSLTWSYSFHEDQDFRVTANSANESPSGLASFSRSAPQTSPPP